MLYKFVGVPWKKRSQSGAKCRSEFVRKRKAILNLGFFVEERWKNLEGLLLILGFLDEDCEEEEETARLKRERSSSSSFREIGTGWRGGRMRGARKKRIGRERRREKVSMNGLENIEEETEGKILKLKK